MNGFNVDFPYEIGTFLSTIKDGEKHIDKLDEYIIDENGISVILELDTLIDPRKSIRIPMERFLADWHVVNKSNDSIYLIQKNKK